MVVRELVALLGIKTDQQSQKKAEGGMSNLLDGVKQLAAAYIGLKSIQFARDMIQDVANLGNQFGFLASKTGLASVELQRLGHVADLAGTEVDDLQDAILNLQEKQMEALIEGNEDFLKTFKKMGVELRNVNGTVKDSRQLFLDYADGIKNIETDAERTQVAMKLMGDVGAKLNPLMKKGSAGILEMMMEIDALGGVMDDKFVKSSEKFVRGQKRMAIVFRSIKIAIARDFMPWANKGTDGIIKWWKANKDWVRSGIVGTLKVFGRVFRAVGGVISHVVGLFVDLWNSFSTGGKRMFVIIGIIKLISLALTAGPIGKLILVGTLIAAVIDDFMVWKEGGISVIGGLIKKIDEFLGIDLVGTIKEWGQAFQNFVAFWLVEPIAVWVLFFQDIFDHGLVEAVVRFIERVKDRFGAMYTYFKDPIEKSVKFFKSVFGEIVGWFEKNVIHPLVKRINSGLLGKAFKFFSGGKSLIDSTAGDKEFGPGGPKKAFGGRAAGGGLGGLKQNLTMNTTINATPGMSENKIADMVAGGVKKAMDTQNRDAIKAFVPQAGGA